MQTNPAAEQNKNFNGQRIRGVSPVAAQEKKSMVEIIYQAAKTWCQIIAITLSNVNRF